MKKILFLLLLAACSVEARQKYNGLCQQGGQYPLTVGYPSTAPFMASYPGCTVTVYQTGTLTLATLYADNLGTPLANPFTANAITGAFGWYANDGVYDIVETGGGLIQPVTVTAVWLVTSGGGGGITALTGDGTASGTGSVVFTLATVNSGPGTCGDATHVCQITTNGKGLETSQTAVAISASSYTFSPPLVNTSGTISLTRTGTGTKAASATTAGVSGDCAYWTSAGDVGDAGAACAVSPTFYTNSTPNATQNALNLVAGSNVTLTNSGSTVTIAASGSGGGTGSIVNKTSSYTILSTDKGNQINDTGSGASDTFSLPATIPTDTTWRVGIGVSNVNGVTISPNGLKLNGATTSTFLPVGGQLYIKTDGVNYYTDLDVPNTFSGIGYWTQGNSTVTQASPSQLVGGAGCSSSQGISGAGTCLTGLATPGTTVSGDLPSWGDTVGGTLNDSGIHFTSGSGAPSGSCSNSWLYLNTSPSSASTVLYVCYSNTWTAVTAP